MKAYEKIDDLGTMPFGKSRGQPIDQVDTGLLRWWLRKMDEDDLRSEYRQAVLDVLAARGDKPPAKGAPRNGAPLGLASARLFLAAEFRAVVKAWFGQFSMKFHPDRGGSHEQMLVVVEAYKSLMAELEKWEGFR